jgi:acyl carrier protein
MDNREVRLTRCFATLFPDLTPPEVRLASMSSVAAWDSVATVTLINLVEEEFGIQVGLEEVEQLVSFQEFLRYLQERTPA